MPSSDADAWSDRASEGLRDHEARRAPGWVPILSRYEVRGRLGEGTSAVVYRAWDLDLRREVALRFVAELGPECPAALTGDAFLRANAAT